LSKRRGQYAAVHQRRSTLTSVFRSAWAGRGDGSKRPSRERYETAPRRPDRRSSIVFPHGAVLPWHHPAWQPGQAGIAAKAAPAEGRPKARTRRCINRAKRTTRRGPPSAEHTRTRYLTTQRCPDQRQQPPSTRPRSQQGPDEVANALALCTLHHALLDLGVLGVKVDLQVVVSPLYVARTPAGQAVHALHGAALRRPQPNQPAPAAAHLSWHSRLVFKGDVSAA
jgi:hypothetical protein